MAGTVTLDYEFLIGNPVPLLLFVDCGDALDIADEFVASAFGVEDAMTFSDSIQMVLLVVSLQPSDALALDDNVNGILLSDSVVVQFSEKLLQMSESLDMGVGLSFGRTMTLSDDFETLPWLVITTTSLPEAAVGVDYSAQLNATGGVPPYTWSLLSGSLPDGLTLGSDGSITGTPTTEETSDFTVQVVDSGGMMMMLRVRM